MDKNIIIETDIGHDPDDWFALCYLQATGVNIRAITITDGDPHQVALVKMFCKEVGLDITIGVASLDRKAPKDYDGDFEGRPVKQYVGFHYDMLKHYGYPYADKVSDLGCNVIKDTMIKYPDTEIFIIGAPKNVSRYINENPDAKIEKITMQGGFLSYDVHKSRCDRLPKFEGLVTCPSYNPNGDIRGTLAIIDSKNVGHLSFVSKNLCHTVVYDKTVHEFMKTVPTRNRAEEMFIKGMDLYLSKHTDKKFHDPCAAVCMLHPEIATWFKGRMYRENGGWGTRPYTDGLEGNSETIVTLDKQKLWQLLLDKT